MTTPPPRIYHCAICGRALRSKVLEVLNADGTKRPGAQVGWIYSQHTTSRYCYVGEGCDRTNAARASGL